jgi:signal peptidase I
MADKYTNINKDQAGIENLVKFETFFANRYLDPFVTGYSFIFVTKPSLFIYPNKPEASSASDRNSNIEKLAYENMTRDQFFSQFLISETMNDSDKILVEQLSYGSRRFSLPYNKNNFMPIFTNRIKNFETTDLIIEQQDAYETKQGFKLPMPTYKTASITSGTIGLDLMETQNLDITKMMGIWVNYISNITDGTFNANPEMIRRGIIDYMSSIYYFVLEPDGKTIKYWAKYTGCWPTNVPFSNLRFTKGEQQQVDVNISFVYTSKEDMNPAILEDFNRVSLNLDNLENELAIEEQNEDYPSVKNSRLLSRERLIGNPNFNREVRSPLVFFVDGKSSLSSNGLTPVDRFELSFGINEFAGVDSSIFVRDAFNEDYFFDEKEFFKSKLDSTENE